MRTDLALAVLIFATLNAPSILTWMSSEGGPRRYLEHPPVLGSFNIVMGLLLAASVMMILTEPG